MKPYPEQLEIAEAAAKYHRGIITAPTGFGKSVSMALIINKLQVKTLIIVPNVELKRQLREAFTKYFGSLDNITIENIDSSSLKNHTDYNCLIIDEAHHSAASTYRKLNRTAWKSIYYRFFFTATPFRSRQEEQLLFESIAGQVIYRVGYHTAVESGYVVPMEAYYVDLPKKVVRGRTWAQVYSEIVVNNEERNNKIASMIKNLVSSGKSVLCLVKEIKHGEILSKLSDSWFANGENEDTKHLISLFNQRKIKGLIGTTGVIGEGVDSKPAEYIIIAGLGKSKNAFMQQCGRGFRVFEGKDSCKIIIFQDKSHKWTKSHFSEQKKILAEEYGVIPTKIIV